MLVLLLATSHAVAAPAAPAAPAKAKPKGLGARMLCDLPEPDYPKDTILKKTGATGPCAQYDRAKETLVVLHAGTSNRESLAVSRWWRTGHVLHVELVASCVPCHGANFGDSLRPALYAVEVTDVDKIEVAKVDAKCPAQDCSGVP